MIETVGFQGGLVTGGNRESVGDSGLRGLFGRGIPSSRGNMNLGQSSRGGGMGAGRGAGPSARPKERGQVRHREGSQEEDSSPKRRGSVLSQADATESIQSAAETNEVRVEPHNSDSGDYQAQDQQLVQPNSIFSIPRNSMVQQARGLLEEQDS